MPNYCYNHVTIEGPKEKIEQLWNRAQESKGLLHAMVPMPEDQAENWYEWNINEWGTKWDVEIDELEYDDENGAIIGSFQSAWSPPTEAMRQYQEKNSDVHIELIYEEEGMDFAGQWEDGEEVYEEDISNTARAIQKETLQYDDASEEFKVLDGLFDFTQRDYSFYDDEEEE